MKTLAAFLLVLVGLALTGFSGRALAATECNTNGGPQIGATPLSGTFVGGVVVNAGDICFLSGANISGGVRVKEGGELYVCASTINGGFIANGAAELIFGAEELNCGGDVINGAVQISNTGPGTLPVSVALERSTINGRVQLSGNRGPIAVATDTIAGALLCRNNAGDLLDEASPSTITGGVTCKFAAE
jgi:hypothetical protein